MTDASFPAVTDIVAAGACAVGSAVAVAAAFGVAVAAAAAVSLHAAMDDRLSQAEVCDCWQAGTLDASGTPEALATCFASELSMLVLS